MTNPVNNSQPKVNDDNNHGSSIWNNAIAFAKSWSNWTSSDSSSTSEVAQNNLAQNSQGIAQTSIGGGHRHGHSHSAATEPQIPGSPAPIVQMDQAPENISAPKNNSSSNSSSHAAKSNSPDAVVEAPSSESSSAHVKIAAAAGDTAVKGVTTNPLGYHQTKKQLGQQSTLKEAYTSRAAYRNSAGGVANAIGFTANFVIQPEVAREMRKECPKSELAATVVPAFVSSSVGVYGSQFMGNVSFESQMNNKPARNILKEKYRNADRSVFKMVKDGSQGAPQKVMRNGVHMAIMTPIRDHLNDAVRTDEDGHKVHITPALDMIADAAVTGTSAAAALLGSMPVDTVMKRTIKAGMEGTKKTFIQVGKETVAKEGVKALYKGLGPAMTGCATNFAIGSIMYKGADALLGSMHKKKEDGPVPKTGTDSQPAKQSSKDSLALTNVMMQTVPMMVAVQNDKERPRTEKSEPETTPSLKFSSNGVVGDEIYSVSSFSSSDEPKSSKEDSVNNSSINETSAAFGEIYPSTESSDDSTSLVNDSSSESTSWNSSDTNEALGDIYPSSDSSDNDTTAVNDSAETVDSADTSSNASSETESESNSNDGSHDYGALT